MIPPLPYIGLCLLLATIVQAQSFISLGGNFQQLPFGITGECRTVYNSPIKDCSAQDFKSSGACSQACVASLKSISNTLNTVCPGVIVDSRTLLGLIFQNRLVQSVCNTIEVPDEPDESEAPTPTDAKSTNTLAAVTTSDEPTQSSTPEALPTPTSTQAPAKSSALGIGDPPGPTPVPSPTETTPEIAVQKTTSSTEEKPSGRSREQQQIDANRDSGGGSPFDNIVLDNAAVNIRRSPSKSLAGALLVAIILVR